MKRRLLPNLWPIACVHCRSTDDCDDDSAAAVRAEHDQKFKFCSDPRMQQYITMVYMYELQHPN